MGAKNSESQITQTSPLLNKVQMNMNTRIVFLMSSHFTCKNISRFLLSDRDPMLSSSLHMRPKCKSASIRGVANDHTYATPTESKVGSRFSDQARDRDFQITRESIFSNAPQINY